MTEDDPDTIIPNQDLLLRGIPPDQWDFDEGRPRTGALNTDDLSVDWSAKRTNEDFIKLHKPEDGLITFKAEFPRSCDLVVRYDPVPLNNAHTVIPGKKPKRFFKAVKRTENVQVVKIATNPAES